jgi:hypothetical protein
MGVSYTPSTIQLQYRCQRHTRPSQDRTRLLHYFPTVVYFSVGAMVV